MGFVKPTPIQQQAIPVILEHHDLIACAQTGTGKTASYLLPLLQLIHQGERKHVSGLILSPTRELAVQIDQQAEGLAYFTGISSIAVYGGGDGIAYEQQKRAIMAGVDIIIATPGRLIAHLTSGVIKLDHIQFLVLDEADRMLDMGFYEDILRISSYLPAKRQTLLFSATMPPKIRTLANKLLHNPQSINIAISQPAAGISQQAYLTYDEQKLALIDKLLKDVAYTSVLIFASRKDKVREVDKLLRKSGIKVKAFHSDLEQPEREAILQDFRNRKLPVIIGTDVLSRGIDITGISLVINFDVPPDPEDYIHRIGRTARAETTGTAITFINEKDQKKFASIEELIGKEVEKIPLPDGLGEGPVYNPKAKREGGDRSNFRNKKKGSWKGKGSSKPGSGKPGPAQS
ncbi:DEAD/DEAH box helicase [Pedobacter sp. HMF7056]|uniref:DEAD/DEAH box helicase n=2 Tax=Hufsiella ginkgonis TaxID=2695274 RepID=A0A7K1Y5E7_9SPHI|nr:DEAD/DEAH box helicase [Hufsiella ginkgonis]